MLGSCPCADKDCGNIRFASKYADAHNNEILGSSLMNRKTIRGFPGTFLIGMSLFFSSSDALAHFKLWPPVTGPLQLQVAIYKLSSFGQGIQTDLSKVEEFGKQLLNDFPDHQGLICFELANIFAQAGMKNPEKVASYSKKAILLLEPKQIARRAAAHLFLGDSLRLTNTGKKFSHVRLEASKVYLDGLAEIEKYQIPDKLPVIPPTVNHHITIAGLGDNTLETEYIKQVEKRAKEQKEEEVKIRTIQRLFRHREVLVRQVSSLYHERPYNRDELKGLVQKQISVESLRGRILANVPSNEKNTLPLEGTKLLEESPNRNWTLLLIINAAVILLLLIVFISRRRASK